MSGALPQLRWLIVNLTLQVATWKTVGNILSSSIRILIAYKVLIIMSNKAATVWTMAWPDIRRDAPFFLSVGFICGVTQYLGYKFFGKLDLGSKILEEHIAFTSMILLTIAVIFGRAAIECKPKIFCKLKFPDFVNHLSDRAIAFSSVSAVAVFGFALSAAVFGSWGYALKFLQASLYFSSLAEISKNPVTKGNWSKIYPISWGIVVTTPFLF